MVEADREGLVVGGPEVLEEYLGLGAGVDEDDGGRSSPDQVQDGRGGVGGGLAGPGRRGLGLEDGDVGVGAGVGFEDAGVGPRNAARAGGSSTVAERPTRRRPGARLCRRARQSASWSPRLVSASAWISSTMMRESEAKIAGASG